MLFGLFLTLGVAVLSVALRSYQTSLAQKLGALGILIASFLAVYFITGNAGWGVAGAGTWLFLPGVGVLPRLRPLRPPQENRLRAKSPAVHNPVPASVEISALDPLDDERMQTDIENDLREQIAHNVRAGVLKPAAKDVVKYSWRGMIYLWCQFLIDLVRL